MYSIRRSCQSALRSSNSSVVRGNASSRAFSRSVARSKGLPVFLEPSSPELAVLLAKINSKVLLPEHLTKSQQKLVYKQSSRAKLETEPVEVTIGDVTLPLEFLDRNKLPDRLRCLTEVIAKAETTADWENVVRVVEGYHGAGVLVRPDWYDMVVRNLLENDHGDIVLRALQRVKVTGLRLSNYLVTFRLLRDCHDRAVRSDWDSEETSKALRYAQHVVELMENEEHHAIPPRKAAKMVQTDWRSRPFVVAVPSELAAVTAQKHSGDVDMVKTLASRLVYALKQDGDATINSVATSSTKSEADFKNSHDQFQALNAHCSNLLELLVIWNALKTSQAVLGADMPLATEAAEYQSRIKQVMDAGSRAISQLKTRGGVELRNKFPAYLTEQLQKVQA